MSIVLKICDRTEPLAARFAADVFQARAGAEGLEFFHPLEIIVPHRNLAKWLQLYLASDRANGIAFNLNFAPLEKCLWDIIFRQGGESLQADRLEADFLQRLLFAQLMSAAAQPASAEQSPVLSYIANAAEPDGCLRAWQVAGRLARLFFEYECVAPEMIARWLAPGRKISDPMEACQRELYCSIFASGGARDRYCREHNRGRRMLTLAQFFFEARETLQPLQRRLFVFCPPHITPLHWRMLLEVAKNLGQTEIYLHSPCACATGLEQSSDCADVAFLASLCRPERDTLATIRRVSEQTGVQPETVRIEPEPCDSVLLLSAFRNHLRGETSAARQDESLQVIGAPGIYREAEAVHDAIVNSLLRDPELKMNDIAILFCDPGKYLPVLRNVFAANTVFGQPLPFNIADSGGGAPGHYSRAALAVLELKDCERNAVFRLFLNPAFMELHRLDRKTVEAWRALADRTGIFRNYSDSSSGPHTWLQGLQRLRLGRIMSPTENDFAFADRIPYADFLADDADLLEKFCVLAEKLLLLVSALPEAAAPFTAWADFLEKTVSEILSVSAKRHESLAERGALLDAAGKLRQMSRLQTEPIRVDGAFVRHWLSEELARPDSHGRPLVDGVTLSTPSSVNGVPFRQIYFLGLEEGSFPAEEKYNPLDLCGERPGKITAPEQDRNLLAKILHNARDRLCLSFIARDLERDSEHFPCPMLGGILEKIETGLLGGEKFRIAYPPVSSFSIEYLREHDENLRDVLTTAAPLRLGFACRQLLANRNECAALAPEAKTGIERLAAKTTARAAPKALPAPTARAELQLRELRDYLANPAEASLRRVAAIYPSDSDNLEDELEEPFAAGRDVAKEIRQSVLRELIVAFPSVKSDWREYLLASFERKFRSAYLKSKLPVREFADLQYQNLKAQIIASVESGEPSLLQYLQARDWRNFYPAVYFSDSQQGAGEAFPLSRPCLREGLALGGGGELVWREGEILRILIFSESTQAPRLPPNSLLLPYLFCQAAALTAEFSGCGKFALAVCQPTGLSEWEYALDKKAAADFLAGLAADLLAPETCLDDLPLAVIASSSELVEAIVGDEPRADDDPEIAELLATLLAEDQAKPERNRADRYRNETLLLATGGLAEDASSPRVPHDACGKMRRRLRHFFSAASGEK
jgi:exonuclease V gamma subunit